MAVTMGAKPKISAMSFAARSNDVLRPEDLDDLLGDPSFRTVADLMSDAIIVIDPEHNIAFLNRAAEKLSAINHEQAEKRSFEVFLRRSGLDMDDWLAGTEKGRREGLIKGKTTGTLIPATRRIIPVTGNKRGYVLITLKPPKREDTSSGPSSSGEKETLDKLVLSAHIEKIVSHAIKAHQRRARVLLLGESGVGKTAIARLIHNRASGADTPFIHVNCASITETLFESEMFGYERGAFTGALQAGKKGFVETAKGGTLFLDEIGEIPLASQAKLLKFLEDGTIQPVGSVMSKRIETTVITATNRDLRVMVQEGAFRPDLFYRITTFPITIPPLRERPDKEALLDSFLARVNIDRKPKLTLSPICRKSILKSDLVGNMRELMSIIDYLDIVVDDEATESDLATDIFSTDVIAIESTETYVTALKPDATLKERVQAFEDRAIEEALSEASSKREAAKALGIDVATLIRKQARNSDKKS
jgi:transcriptional regulator with PAS, ATPase and Fis domain